MRRLVSSLLILMILASQGLCAMHVHVGSDRNHTDTHSGRPHVHSSNSHGHQHHAHVHRDKNAHRPDPVSAKLTDASDPQSDSVPFYLPDPVNSQIGRSGCTELSEWLSSRLDYTVDGITVQVVSQALDGRQISPCQWSTARTPLYLRSLVIRC